MTHLHLSQDRAQSLLRGALIASVLLRCLTASVGLAQEVATSDAAASTEDAALSATLSDSGAPLVQTEDGVIQGLSSTTPTRVFLGIPYAQAPLGALRFRPPLPANRWSGIKRTDSFGPACPQPRGGFAAEGPQSEDCLSLNVFAANRGNNNAPVMVFIHGGAFITGAGAQVNAQSLAEAGKNIVVTINYRLGALGFLSLPELDAEGVASGNNALRDQQLALAWIKKNIRAFGGDPNNITVFGESAGSVSACIQMVSPLSRTLANRFIMESGTCDAAGTSASLAQARATSARVTNALCAGRSDLLACLRAAPVADILGVSMSTSIFDLPWLPVVNPADPLLPQSPKALIVAGNYNHGAAIIGSNARELGLFQLGGSAPVVRNIPELSAVIDARFGAAAPLVKQQYSAASDAEANDVLIRLGTDLLFRCPSRALARRTSAQGSAVFLYHFEEGLAFHAFELPYVFRMPDARLGAATLVEPVRQQFQTAFTSFAASAEPRPALTLDGAGGLDLILEQLPPWPRYATDTDRHISIRSTSVEGTGLSRSDCDLLESIGAVQ